MVADASWTRAAPTGDVLVGVGVDVFVDVAVAVGVAIGVRVAVGVLVSVNMAVGVAVGVLVGTGVIVGVAVSAGCPLMQRTLISDSDRARSNILTSSIIPSAKYG